MGDYLDVEAYLVVGGESVPDMIRRLNAGVHVVVGKYQLTAYLYVSADRRHNLTRMHFFYLSCSVEKLE